MTYQQRTPKWSVIVSPHRIIGTPIIPDVCKKVALCLTQTQLVRYKVEAGRYAGRMSQFCFAKLSTLDSDFPGTTQGSKIKIWKCVYHLQHFQTFFRATVFVLSLMLQCLDPAHRWLWLF